MWILANYIDDVRVLFSHQNWIMHEFCSIRVITCIAHPYTMLLQQGHAVFTTQCDAMFTINLELLSILFDQIGISDLHTILNNSHMGIIKSNTSNNNPNNTAGFLAPLKASHFDYGQFHGERQDLWPMAVYIIHTKIAIHRFACSHPVGERIILFNQWYLEIRCGFVGRRHTYTITWSSAIGHNTRTRCSLSSGSIINFGQTERHTHTTQPEINGCKSEVKSIWVTIKYLLFSPVRPSTTR